MRVPKCGKCKKHGIIVPVKGHKKYCPFKKCVCKICFKSFSANTEKKQKKLYGFVKQTEDKVFVNDSTWRRRRTFGDASLYDICEPKIWNKTERIYVLPPEILNQKKYTEFTVERLMSPEKFKRKLNLGYLHLNLQQETHVV